MDDKTRLKGLLADMGVKDVDGVLDGYDGSRPTLAMVRLLRPLQKTLNEYLEDYEGLVRFKLGRPNDPEYPLVKEMADKGVEPETIGKLCYWTARSAYNELLYRLDDPAGADYDLDDEGSGLPSWALKERDGAGRETGRTLQGLSSVFPFERD